jgi:hypothetical protein
MSFHYVVTPAGSGSPVPPTTDTAELLRQILDVQREQLQLQRNAAAAHDVNSRWRAFIARWQQDFPDLPEACRHALPILERTYGSLMAELSEHLRSNDVTDNEFALGEFLDRYGMRLNQLGSLLSLVSFLAEASNPPGEPSA